MKRLEEKVLEMVEKNAVHKTKNFRMKEVLWMTIIDNLYSEVEELDNAHFNFIGLPPNSRLEAIKSEIGDILTILVHASVKIGFTMDEICERALTKIEERFEYEGQSRESAKAADVSNSRNI